MTSLFDPTKLVDNPWRSVAIAAGVLPLIGIYTTNAFYPTSKDYAADVVGRPPSGAFIAIWIIITLLLVFEGVLHAFRADVVWLAAFCFLAIAVTIVTVLWLIYTNRNNDNSTGIQMLGTLLFIALLLMSVSATVKTDDNQEEVQLILTGSSAVIFGWVIYAFVLDVTNAN